MTNLIFGPSVERINHIIQKKMPQLPYTIWDLTPFLPLMHNWRRDILFIECDPVGVEPVMELLAPNFPKVNIYAGARKPTLKINRVVSEWTIVIVARAPKEKTGEVSVEKCLVDMLHYSSKELIPLHINEVLDLWEQLLSENGRVGFPKVRFSELYRYASRRYLGWFVSIYAYALSKQTKVVANKRHLATGRANLELIRKLDSFEPSLKTTKR